MLFTFKQRKVIFTFLRLNIGLLVFVLWLYVVLKGRVPDLDLLLGVFFATRIPLLVLFISYYLNDHKSEFSFERSKNALLYVNGCQRKSFTFDQIKSITLTASGSRLRKDLIRNFLAEEYFYYQIFLTNGDSIVITSLLLDGKLIKDINFKGIEIQKERKVYCFLPDGSKKKKG